jgi:pilus assembly protein Flp/PilA
MPPGIYERATRIPELKERSMLMYLENLWNVLTQPLRRDDRGVTAVEYALLLTMLAAVVIGALVTFGGDLAGVFTNFVTKANW